MSQSILQRPLAVSILWILLLVSALHGAVNTVLNVFDNQAFLMMAWPLLLGSLVSSLLSFGLKMAAILCILKGLRLGWLLAGVALVSHLLGSVTGVLQATFIRVNEQSLYLTQPGLLYTNLITFAVSLGLLVLLFSDAVRAHLGIQENATRTALLQFIVLGVLFTLVLWGIMVLASWLNTLVM